MPDDSYVFSEAIKMLKNSYEERMPFNRFLGLTVVTLDSENVSVKVKMKEGLIGNFIRGMIHGGVISSLIDIVGGLSAAAQVIKKMGGMPAKDLEKRIERVSTVDLRVYYLRPGLGDYFLCKGSVLRMGEKVATIGMELTNEGGSSSPWGGVHTSWGKLRQQFCLTKPRKRKGLNVENRIRRRR